MEQAQFLQIFKKLKGLDETANILQQAEIRVHWKGLIGSSKSIAVASVCEQVPGNHLFILEDKEAAAYFLNDLEQLFPENKHIFFLPGFLSHSLSTGRNRQCKRCSSCRSA